MTADAHTIRTVAEAVIAEDRVPVDVLAELIEQHGDDTHKDAAGLDWFKEEEHDPRACPSCGCTDFQQVDWAPVGYSGEWDEAGEWEDGGHGGEVFWDGARAQGIECRNCVTAVEWDPEAGRLKVAEPRPLFADEAAEAIRTEAQERDSKTGRGGEFVSFTNGMLHAAGKITGRDEIARVPEPVANG